MKKINQQKTRLTDPNALIRFFLKCNEKENGVEPDWADHQKFISDSYQSGKKPIR